MLSSDVRNRWVDMASEIARHQVTSETVQDMDFETYYRLFLLLRESNRALGSEQAQQDQDIEKLRV